MDARLATGIWVSAYMARLRLADIPVYVTRKGDNMAGAVLVKVALMNGIARLYERGYDLETGARVWRLVEQALEGDLDAVIRRSMARDPDLWVLELEDRKGRTLLEEEGLAS